VKYPAKISGTYGCGTCPAKNGGISVGGSGEEARKKVDSPERYRDFAAKIMRE